MSINYNGLYNDYWSQDNRIGKSSFNMNTLCDLLISTVEIKSALDIGCGEGALVSKLNEHNIAAQGIDISDTVINRAKNNFGDYYSSASILEIPFSTNYFDCTISTDCLEHLQESDIDRAISEIIRVSKRYVFIQVATAIDYEGKWHLTVKSKEWWLSQFTKMGLTEINFSKVNGIDIDELTNHPKKAYFIFIKP